MSMFSFLNSIRKWPFSGLVLGIILRRERRLGKVIHQDSLDLSHASQVKRYKNPPHPPDSFSISSTQSHIHISTHSRIHTSIHPFSTIASIHPSIQPLTSPKLTPNASTLLIRNSSDQIFITSQSTVFHFLIFVLFPPSSHFLVAFSSLKPLFWQQHLLAMPRANDSRQTSSFWSWYFRQTWSDEEVAAQQQQPREPAPKRELADCIEGGGKRKKPSFLRSLCCF